MAEQNVIVQHLFGLVGKTVKCVVRDGNTQDEECFGLEFTDGTVVWIMRDPEGNGPGFLDIVEKS